MTSYRLMDGVSGRPGTGSSVTQPPAASTSYSGPYGTGTLFSVTRTCWFQGYWWYVADAAQSAVAQKFALWLPSSVGTPQYLVPGSVVTSGTLSLGWNWVPLATPMLLSVNWPYRAVTAFSNNFPLTNSQFNAGEPYAAGIVNGPLNGYSGTTGTNLPPWSIAGPQCSFQTSSSDPTVLAGYPAQDDAGFNGWLDLQVTDTPPPGAAYSLWPNLPFADVVATGDSGNGYTMATEFSLSEACKLTKIRFWSAPGAGGLPSRCAIWDVASQTVVAGTDKTSPSWSGAAASGWVYVDYSSAGVTLAGGKNYKVAVYSAQVTGGWRSATTPFWAAGGTFSPVGQNGITIGPISAPNTASATPPGQDSWNGPNAPWAYPGSYSNPENDWVDIEVTLPPASGARPSFTAGITAVAKALKFQAASRAVTSATAAAARVFRHRSASRTVTVTISAAASHSGTAHSAGTRPSLTAAMSAVATALRHRTSSRTQTATVSASATVTRHRSATRTVTAATTARAAVPGGGRTASLPVAARLTARTAHSTVRGTHATMTAVISATAAKSGTGNASPGAIAILAVSSGPPGTLTASSGPTAGGG